MYWLYTALLGLYFALRLPAAAYRMWRRGGPAGHLGERFGRLPAAVNPGRRPAIWIHAVSVGEAIAARPLIRAVRGARPAHRLVLSTTTPAGRQVARQFGPEVDAVVYAPFDLPSCVGRALDRIAPALLIVVETELWPNLLRACRRRGVRTAVVNGRLSDRSFRGYGRARRFMRRVLADVDRICAQSDDAGRRFVALGARPERVTITGSLKFDAAGGAAAADGAGPDGAASVDGRASTDGAASGAWAGPADRAGRADGAARTGGTGPANAPGPDGAPASGPGAAAADPDPLLTAFAFARGRPVLIAASTLAGEEAPVCRAFAAVRRIAPEALLVLAPRQPDRFAAARAAAERAGFEVRLRSGLGPGGRPAGAGVEVVILDTLGELGRLFRIASTVFVGGSLVDAGGHNLIEPAAWGAAIVVGPHMENFAEVTRTFAAQGAVVQVRTAGALEAALVDLMQDAARRRRLGEAARAVVAAHRGATRRTLDVVTALLPPESGVHRGVARDGARRASAAAGARAC